MLGDTKAFSGFGVDDLQRALEFYGETLGLKTNVIDEEHGLMSIELAGGDTTVLAYTGQDHRPPSYTILNFSVDDIDETVDELARRGVSFERYQGFDHDEKGVMRGPGPQIAWFKDPAGNVLSVLQEG